MTLWTQTFLFLIAALGSLATQSAGWVLGLLSAPCWGVLVVLFLGRRELQKGSLAGVGPACLATWLVVTAVAAWGSVLGWPGVALLCCGMAGARR